MDIKRIEKLYPNWYSKDSDFSYDDQKWIWGNFPLHQEDIERITQIETNERDGHFYKDSNCARKQHTNLTKKLSKKEAIIKLKHCHYRTASNIVASYLDIILSNDDTRPGHWLYTARRYTPKTINSVLWETIKGIKRGDIDFEKRAAYFTFVIKKRKPRKKFRKEVKQFTHPDF